MEIKFAGGRPTSGSGPKTQNFAPPLWKFPATPLVYCVFMPQKWYRTSKLHKFRCVFILQPILGTGMFLWCLLIYTFICTLSRQSPFLRSHQCGFVIVAGMFSSPRPAPGQSHLPFRIQVLMSLVSKQYCLADFFRWLKHV